MHHLLTLIVALALTPAAFAQSDSGDGVDTSEPAPTGDHWLASDRAGEEQGGPGCACSSAPGGAFPWGLALGIALVARRRG